MSPVIEHLPAGAGPLAAAPLKRAFVISESRHLYTLARSLLNAAGVQDVGFSSDTRSAEIRMPGFEPDLIVADWPDNLPGHQDRIGLLRRLRTHSETGLQEKPVILLTPPRTQSRVEQARDAGATELLVMPVSMSQFSQRVTSLARRPRAFVSSPRFKGHCRRRRREVAPREAFKRQVDIDAGRVTRGRAALNATLSLAAEIQSGNEAVARRIQESLGQFSRIADLERETDVELVEVSRTALIQTLAAGDEAAPAAEAVAENLERFVGRRLGRRAAA